RLSDASAPAPIRVGSLKAMAQSGLKEVPAAWMEGLARVLGGGDRELVGQAVATARALPLNRDKAGKITPRLLAIASRAEMPAEVRLGALAAVPGGLDRVEPAPFAFLLSKLDREHPSAVRSAATDVLSKA